MPITQDQLKFDELARNLCKPLGCRVVSCLSGRRQGGCGPEMNALNECLKKKRDEIDQAIKEGRSLSTIAPVSLACDE